MQLTEQGVQAKYCNCLQWNWVLRIATKLGFAAAMVLFVNNAAIAQRRPVADDTLGNERSIVTPDTFNGRQGDRIDGGATRGENLFHSFQDFGVDEGRSVYFSNPAGIRNILSRVTGSNVSEILGVLGVLGDANLFLLNPNGIIFGPNAQLDVRGSFLASTGDRFSFPDGSEFSANTPQASPLLTVNVPIGLQLGTGTEPIVNRGNLTVGQDLTLAGGNLDLEGQLHAGRDLTLLAQDTIRVRDTASIAFAATAGRDLVLQSSGGIDVLALQHPEQTPFVSGGTLSLISDGVISADAHFASGGNFQIRSLSGQPARLTSLYDPIISSAANVDIDGGYEGASLLIESQGNVRIQGAVTITEPDTVSSFVGADTVLSTRPGLIIRSGQTDLVYSGINQGDTPTFSFGNMPAGITLEGSVRVVPNEQGGVVNLTAARGNITVASIDASNLTRGDGGAIMLTAANEIITTDNFPDPFGIPTALGSFSYLGSFSDSDSSDVGNGGMIALTAGGSITTDRLNSSSRLLPILGSEGGNAGNGGEITIASGGSIKVSDLDSSSFSATGYGGHGGRIMLSADDSIATGGLLSLSSSTLGNGSGGAIILSAGTSITTTYLNSSVTSGNLGSGSDEGNGINGDGGTIMLSAGTLITADRLDSSASASSINAGNGGVVTLSADTSSITTRGINSSSSSSSGNAGNGGEIMLSAGGFIKTDDLDSSSSVPFSLSGHAGNGGAIMLSASDSIMTSGLNSSSRIGDLALDLSPSSGNAGNGGEITLLSSSGNVMSTGTINWGSSTSGQLNGTLRVNTPGAVQFNNASLRPDEADIVIGDQIAPNIVQMPRAVLTRGGSIYLFTSGDILLQDTDLITSSRNSSSGQIQIQTPGSLSLERSRLFTSIEPERTGTGGSITINVGNLALNNFSVIDTATFGTGDAGNLNITAANAVTLNHSDIVSVTVGNGNAGQIFITTGGDVTLQNRSSISTAARLGSMGRSGNISIDLQAGTLTLAGGSQLQAFTQGSNAGGNITIQAPNVTVAGFDMDGVRSGIFTSSDRPNSGNGGNITVTVSSTLRVADSGVLSAQTLGSAEGGSISVAADTMQLLNGGQLVTSTAGNGQAGNIILNIARQVEMVGTNSIQETILPQFTCTINGTTCKTSNNADVEFSTRIPYATLEGTQESGTDVFVFNIPVPGIRGVFDIDGGGFGEVNESGQRTFLFGVDTRLALIDAQGNVIASNDNADSSLGEEGSLPDNLLTSNERQTLSTGPDAYLRYVFSEPGTYTIQVDKESGVFPDSTYALHVSLEAPAVAGRVIETSPSSGLFARTTSGGGAGSITINTPQLNILDQAQVSVETVGQGNAGTIELQPFEQERTLSVNLGNGQISGSTTSTGHGGGLHLRAPDAITLLGEGLLAVETLGSGQAGNITITTDTLSVDHAVSITATSRATATNTEGGGSITLNASNLDLAGTVGIFAETQGAAPAGTLTLQPNNGQSTLDIDLSGGARISASTSSSGQGGDLSITAPEAINIRGNGQLAVETSGTGRAGNISITTPRLTILDEAEVSASTSNEGEGGSLFVNAPISVLLSNQGQLLTESTGSGRAGNLAINTPQLTLEEGAEISASNQSSSGGDINLNVGSSLSLNNNSQISASTQSGQGGNVTIRDLGTLRVLNSLISAESETGMAGVLNVNASDSIVLSGTGTIASELDQGGLSVRSNGGIAGTLNVTTNELNIRDGASIAVSNSGLGNAGDLTITARDVSLDRGNITGTTEAGAGGNIDLTIADALSLTNNSQISAATQSGRGGDITIQDLDTLRILNSLISAASTTGQAGQLNVNAADSIVLRGAGTIAGRPNQGGLSVSSNGGVAGNLTVTTNQLNIRDGASIAVSNTGQGNGGDLTIHARDVLLNRGNITGTTEAGRGGAITLNISDTLQLRNNSLISASTQSGRGGDITIRGLDSLRVVDSLISAESTIGQAGRLRVHASDSVLLDGRGNRSRGGLSVQSSGGRRAGTLTVTTNELNVHDRASIAVSNTGRGDAGDLTIHAREVSLDRGRIVGTTVGGRSGDIELNNLDSLWLDNRSEISASTETGEGGNLSIGTREGGDITLSDDSRLAAAAIDGGTAGSLGVNNTDTLTIEDGSNITVSSEAGEAGNLRIHATSVSLDNGTLEAIAGAGNGGNITVNTSGRLLQLSNSSRISAQALNEANGGNVTLRVANGFVVANPLENSDILANAEGQGNGGNINITTQSIFGLEERESISALSDINASSQFGLDGTIELNTLNVDPAQGVVALPDNVAPPTQVDQRCATGSRGTAGERGEFVVTGRGGLPPNADEALGSDAVQVDLVTDEAAASTSNPTVSLPDADAMDEVIVEAQGWVIDANGNVVLTAAVPTATPIHSQFTLSCPSQQSVEQE